LRGAAAAGVKTGIPMTDRELLYVKTVAEERSLSKAAQKLFLTQPALSKSIQKIESDLGTKLFRRTAGGSF
jgi:DNA-binding transcriptional LysR family regulator